MANSAITFTGGTEPMPTPSADQLPKALTSLPNWVGWREEVRPGSTRKTKVPYSLATGHRASSTNPSDWIPYPDPAEVPADYDGIGFVFTKDAGMVGIDLDDCIVNGVLKQWGEEVLAAFQATYRETSPSGRGIKLFVKSQLTDKGLKVYVDMDGNRTVESMSDGAIEMYDTGRYFTVTGAALGPLTVAPLQAETTALYARLRGNERPELPVNSVPTGKPFDIPAGAAISEGGRHKFLISTAAKWRARGMELPELLVKLRELNALRCSPPKPDYMLKGIADWFADKPPAYRPTRADYGGAAQWATGSATATSPPPPTGGSAPQASALPDDEPVEAPTTPPSTPLAFRVGQAIARGVESCYETDLARLFALAYLDGAQSTIEADTLEDKLKKTFGKELNLQRFRRAIKLIREEMVAAAPADRNGPVLTATGMVAANLANAITMMAELPLRYNSFACRVFLTEPSPWDTIGNWIDYDDVKATEWCQRQSLNVDVRTVSLAADAVARQRPHFHPVQEYLKQLKWDGEMRLSEWLINYLGAEDNEYVRQVARKWMISAVKRACEPGCQADYTLVLEGTQGKRKSSAIRTLCGNDWFSDDVADIRGSDAAMQLQGKWIVELAELDAFKKAGTSTIKAWLGRRTDYFRPPYGRRADDFPRQNVFAATTNKNDWLQDDTGGRRFWPVKTGKIDVDGLAKVRDQLWAEAFFYYSEGELSYLSEDIEALAGKEQHARQESDIWTDKVLDWVNKIVAGIGRSSRERIYPHDVLEHCLKISPEHWDRVKTSRVTRILRLAGYEPKRESKCDVEVGKPAKEYWTRITD